MLSFLVVVSVCFTNYASSYYNHTIIAQTGQAGLTGIKSAPSINDSGSVAFVGQVASGEGVFFADGQTVVNLSPNHSSSTFSTFFQINNSRNVVARDSGGGIFFVRLWNVASPGSPTVVDSTSGIRQSYCTGGFNAGQPCGSSFNCPDLYNPGVFYPCAQPPQTHYISLLFPALNNNAEIAYIGGITGTTTNALVFVGREDSHEYPLPDPNRTMRAIALADNGRIVARAGNSSSSPIWMFERNLASYIEVASPAIGFSTLGELPGISDDGSIVVFTGNRGNGLGLFINFTGLSGSRVTLNIAGENATTPKPELGQLDPNSPIFFGDFDLINRVAVKSISPQTTSLENAEVLITFVATPNLSATDIQVGSQILSFSAARGIWTIRGFLRRSGGELAFRRERVFPVIQIGDPIGAGGSLPVDNFSIYDPLATVTASPNSLQSHYVAFGASSGSSQVIVRSIGAGKPVTIMRTSKTTLLRPDAPYGDKKYTYWGHVTASQGNISFDQNGQARQHPCWQAQDIVPAGTYHGEYDLLKWDKALGATVEPKLIIGRPCVHLVDAPVRPNGISSIWIHYARDPSTPPPLGTGFDDSTGKHWTTGCIVFENIEQLAPPTSGSLPTDRDYIVQVVDAYPPLTASDYTVSGTVTNPATGGGLPGVVIKVLRGSTVVGQMTTDSQGHFWISGLQPPGSYSVVPEVSGYGFLGVRRPIPLPWLPREFERNFAIQTSGFPPDCYGVDFVAVRDVKLRLFGQPLGSVQPDGTIQVTFVIKNTGATDAAGVTITAATLGTTSLTAGLPDAVGAVAAGNSFTRTMVFPAGSATAGGWSRLKLLLTHTTAGTTGYVRTSTRARIAN